MHLAKTVIGILCPICCRQGSDQSHVFLLPLTLLLSGSINRCFEKHHGQCYCQRRRLPRLPLDKSEAAETRGESAG